MNLTVELFSMYTLYKYIFFLTCTVAAIPTIYVASELVLPPNAKLTAGGRSARIKAEVYRHKPDNGSWKTLDAEIQYQKRKSQAEDAVLNNTVNHCFAEACNGIINLRPLEEFILEHSVMGQQRESPWKTIRNIRSHQYATEYGEAAECALPHYDLSRLLYFTIQSHLDLRKHDQLAEDYLSIVKKVFSTKPSIDVDAIKTAMNQLDLLSNPKTHDLDLCDSVDDAQQSSKKRKVRKYTKKKDTFLLRNKIKCEDTSTHKKIIPAYILGIRHFVDPVVQQELERCIPLKKHRSLHKTTINLFDFLDVVCYALYHNETLHNFDVEGSNVQRATLQARLIRLEREPFWQHVECILKKAVQKFEQTKAQISIKSSSNV
jgi:hypothetical protein